MMNHDKETRCSNCTTTTTPLWRRGQNGTYLCNACGLYYKIHQSNRPIELKTDTFKHRQRLRRGNGHIYHTYKYDENGLKVYESYVGDENIQSSFRQGNVPKETFKFYNYYEKLVKENARKEEKKEICDNKNFKEITDSKSEITLEMSEIDVSNSKNNSRKKYRKKDKKEISKIIEQYENLTELEKNAVLILASLNKEKDSL